MWLLDEIKKMGKHAIGRIILGNIALVVGLALWSIFAVIQDAKEWETFKVIHQCKVVGQKEGITSFSTMIDPKGNVMMVPITTPAQTGYKCDDGITYWR